MKNISPRINTHDSIDRIKQLKFYCSNRGNSNDKYVTTIQNFQTVILQSIESINQKCIAITGSTQPKYMSPHLSAEITTRSLGTCSFSGSSQISKPDWSNIRLLLKYWLISMDHVRKVALQQIFMWINLLRNLGISRPPVQKVHQLFNPVCVK